MECTVIHSTAMSECCASLR